jgi:hypothetical protein
MRLEPKAVQKNGRLGINTTTNKQRKVKRTMKQGQTLGDLAKQIKAEHEAKHDFVAPTNRLHFAPTGPLGTVEWRVGKASHEAAPTRHCLRQICERSGIPSKYADRMLGEHGEHAALLAENINYWWKHAPEKRMLRTLMNGANHARAFVSDIYRPLDNHDLADIILPKLAEVGCEVISAQVTETRLYIQAATPRMELDLNKLRQSGVKLSDVDPVQAGIVISNSEVGAGSLALDQLLYKLSCFNGMIAGRLMRRHHVGRRNEGDIDEAAEYYSDKTKEMDDRVFWNKVRDVVDGIFTMSRFETLCQKFADAASVRISGSEAVEEVTKRYQLVESEKNSILNHLIEGGELNVFGLVNAVTRASSDVESYDRAVELERIGGEIIELPAKTWSLN